MRGTEGIPDLVGAFLMRGHRLSTPPAQRALRYLSRKKEESLMVQESDSSKLPLARGQAGKCLPKLHPGPSSTFCPSFIASLASPLLLIPLSFSLFLPPQPGKWGLQERLSQDPQFKIKSDPSLSPSSLPNNHTRVKEMFYIRKREASLERAHSDNF